MKKFQAPELIVCKFDVEDIISVSREDEFLDDEIGDINTNFMFLYLVIAVINECTVLPNFKSPHKPIVKLSSLPFSLDIVKRSVKVCVG